MEITAALYKLELTIWQCTQLALARKNPRWHEQPRAPAGTPQGGQWVDDETQLIGGERRVFITAAVAALARAFNRIRQYVIATMKIIPLPLTTEPPPLLAGDDHVVYTGSARRPYMPYLEFESFEAFKYVLGALAPGYHLHHIVEQRMAERLGKFPARAVHNTDNIILLSREEHACISRYYSRSGVFNHRYYSHFRLSLNDESWAEQYRIGIEYIYRCRRETRSRKPRRR